MRKSVRTNDVGHQCVWMDKKTHQKVKIIAAIRGQKVAEVLREIISKYKYKKTVRI